LHPTVAYTDRAVEVLDREVQHHDTTLELLRPTVAYTDRALEVLDREVQHHDRDVEVLHRAVQLFSI
jgi:translation initiation factor 2B subunit (eIF-2B alpha/beta/delta family)